MPENETEELSESSYREKTIWLPKNMAKWLCSIHFEHNPSECLQHKHYLSLVKIEKKRNY